jgi:hypothetical protein
MRITDALFRIVVIVAGSAMAFVVLYGVWWYFLGGWRVVSHREAEKRLRENWRRWSLRVRR